MQIAIGERQQAGKHPPLIALLALALQIHLALGGHDGFDIVGLPQCFHPHIVIHAQENVFQISAGKPVFGDFPDAAVLHVAADQRPQHRTDLRFSLAAVSLNHHHALSLVAGNQAIADKLLQGWNILRIQQSIQKGEPECRCRGTRMVRHRQSAAHNVRSALGKAAIQCQRAVCQMNPICFRREVLYMSCQLHHFQNVGDLARDVVHGAAFQLLVDFAAKRQIIGHSAVRCEEGTVGKDDFPTAQKLVAKQRLIDICAIEPDRRI